jgi:hypothetical protein
MIRKTIIKALALASAVAGLGVGMAGPAAAWTCNTVLVEKYELYLPGANNPSGVLNRYDTAFNCPGNTAEQRKSYTRSHLNGAWHKVTHSIYDMSDGRFLRSTTKSGYDTIQTTPLVNRTSGEYHYSGFLVTNIHGTRLSVQYAD